MSVLQQIWSIIKKFVLSANVFESTLNEEIHSVRERFLRNLLYITVIAAFPALFIATSGARAIGDNISPIFYPGLFIVVLCTTIFQNRIPFAWKTLIFLGAFFALGIHNLIHFGFSGAGIHIFLIVSVLMTVLLGQSVGVLILIAGMASILGVGVAMSTGVVSLDLDLNSRAGQMVSWITAAGVFLLLASVGVLIPGKLQSELVRSLDKLKKQSDKLSSSNKELEKEISKRKQAEEALRQSENYYRTIFETSATAILILEEDTTISHVNSNFEKLLGYSKQEVEGKKSWTEFIHPGDLEWMKENHYLRRRDPRAASLNYEFRFFVRNGELRNGYLTIDMIPGTAQSVVSLIDITERKQAEQQLKESEERFSKAFRSSPAPQVISDIITGEFIDVNDRWLDMLGYAREQLIGRTSKEVGIWADPGQRDRIIQKLQENAFFNEEPVEFRTSNGSTVYALWSAERITLKGRHVLLGMLYDETERKQAEKEQERLHAQLAQAQKMESVGRLAGGVAHDFNNKLSIINGYAELAMETIDPSDPLYETIQEIYTAGKKSADIVRQLLAFARKQTISPVMLDLNDTISGMLKMLQRLIGENIDLEWHPGKNLWSVKIDPSQLDQIMANLAVNSRDAISDVGKLTIETDNIMVDEDYCRGNPEAIPGQYVMLAVSDDGCGMDKEVQDFLFEPFFTTKEIGKGTGLGLPTIYGIVKQNKGFINVYSEPGEGTTLKLYFPSHEETKSSMQPAKESTGQMPGGTEIILVVEDEKTILQMSKQMLERLGYTVETATSLSEALQISEEYDGTIHLLITDVIMPEINGRDLSSQLFKSHPALKTLYMSGYTADVIAHHGVLDDGVQFIQKPFSLKDLAVKVREVLEQE